jgi:hypothetical protein
LLNVLHYATIKNMALPPWAAAVISATEQRNGNIVETSPALASMVRSNTNAMFLGSAVAARNAMFYLVKYLSKSVTPLAHAATLLHDVLNNYDKYGRKANEEEANGEVNEANGDNSRMVKSVLQRLVNSSCGMVELGAPLAVFMIFEGKRFECTHEFKYVSPYGLL